MTSETSLSTVLFALSLLADRGCSDVMLAESQTLCIPSGEDFASDVM